MKLKDIYLSYSYERIMPGKKYYDSIINNNRCYSGFDKASKNKTKNGTNFKPLAMVHRWPHDCFNSFFTALFWEKLWYVI